MSSSKSKERARQKGKMIFMILLTTAMFVVEIVVGYRTGSLALVNDSFNMISAIVSLVIGFICLWLSTKENKKNTYGWARVEIWAALVNSVFMLALCFSIFTTAIQKLVSPEKIEEADLVLIVGGVGFGVNIIGILVFLNETLGDLKKNKKTEQQASDFCPRHSIDRGQDNSAFRSSEVNLQETEPRTDLAPPVKVRKMSVTEADLPKNWPHVGLEMIPERDSSFQSAITADDEMIPDVFRGPTTPNGRRHSLIGNGLYPSIPRVVDDDDCCDKSDDEEISSVVATVSHIYAGPPVQEEEEIPYRGDKKKKKKKIKSGNQMNIQGVFLHLLGDLLGSVSVIISGLINKFCHGEWVDRIDPAISLVVVIIIVISTIPLVKQTSNVLLQRVPKNVNIPVLIEELKKEVKDIANIHDLHVWQLVGTRIIASMHIRCSDLSQYIRVSKKIKTFFHNNGIHSTTIQPEFLEHMVHPHRSDRECFLECGPEMKCHEDTCCCAVKKSKKKISTTSTGSGISFQSAISTDTAISIDSDIGTSFS